MTSTTAASSNGQNRNGRVRTGQRFWRAVMGAPYDSSSSDSEEELGAGEEDEDAATGRLIQASALEDIGRGGMTAMLTRRLKSLRSIGRQERNRGNGEPDAIAAASRSTSVDQLDDLGLLDDAEGDGGETTDAGVTTTAILDEDDEAESAAEALHRLRVALRRRRRQRMRLRMAAIAGETDQGGSSISPSASIDWFGFSSLFGTATTRKAAASAAAAAASAARGSRTSGGEDEDDGDEGCQPNGNRSRNRNRNGNGSGSGSGREERGTNDHRRRGRRGGAPYIKRTRIFHWQVAIKRNVAPIGVLAYLTLWGVLLGGR